MKYLSLVILIISFNLQADDTLNSTFKNYKISTPSNYSSLIEDGKKSSSGYDVSKQSASFKSASFKNPNYSRYVDMNGNIRKGVKPGSEPKKTGWRAKMIENVKKSAAKANSSGDPKKDMKAKADRKMLEKLRKINLDNSAKEIQIIKKYNICLMRLSLSSLEAFKKCESKKRVAIKSNGKIKNNKLSRLKVSYREFLIKNNLK